MTYESRVPEEYFCLVVSGEVKNALMRHPRVRKGDFVLFLEVDDKEQLTGRKIEKMVIDMLRFAYSDDVFLIFEYEKL